MKLVSNNEALAAEKARQEREKRENDAMATVEVATKRLAANLMRIAADGGKSYEVVGQLVEMLKAVDKLSEINPASVSTAIERGLEVQRADSIFVSPREAIIQASLRLYASKLLGQTTQVANADTALFNAIKNYNERKKD